MSYKNFKSPTADVRRIALTEGGHIFLIGTEWKPVPEFAWSSAYAAGCISEDMAVNGNIPAELLRTLADESVLIEEIKKTILQAVEDGTVEAFNKDGSPKATWVRTALGKKDIGAHVVDRVWSKIQNGI